MSSLSQQSSISRRTALKDLAVAASGGTFVVIGDTAKAIRDIVSA